MYPWAGSRWETALTLSGIVDYVDFSDSGRGRRPDPTPAERRVYREKETESYFIKSVL